MNPLVFGTSIFSICISARFVVGLASIGSGIGQGTPMDIVLKIGAIFFIGLIAFIYFYSYTEYKSKKSQESEKSTYSKRKEWVIIIIIRDTYYSLISFFLLCSYSNLYIYNLDQEYNLPFVIKREDLC